MFSIRGRLSTFSQISRVIGVLVAFIVNAVVDYEYVPCIFIFIPFLYAILFMLLPNTPQYYLQKNQDQVSMAIFLLILNNVKLFYSFEQEAKNSLKYYKGYQGNSEKEDNAIDAEFDRIKSISKQQKSNQKIVLADLCKS